MGAMGPVQNAGMGKPTPPMGMGAMAAMGGMPPAPATYGWNGKAYGYEKRW
jgi:hypothetical protein